MKNKEKARKVIEKILYWVDEGSYLTLAVISLVFLPDILAFLSKGINLDELETGLIALIGIGAVGMILSIMKLLSRISHLSDWIGNLGKRYKQFKWFFAYLSMVPLGALLYYLYWAGLIDFETMRLLLYLMVLLPIIAWAGKRYFKKDKEEEEKERDKITPS